MIVKYRLMCQWKWSIVMTLVVMIEIYDSDIFKMMYGISLLSLYKSSVIYMEMIWHRCMVLLMKICMAIELFLMTVIFMNMATLIWSWQRYMLPSVNMEESLSKALWRTSLLVSYHLMRILYDQGLALWGLMCLMLKDLCLILIVLCISVEHLMNI